jgi:hypothetical protein
MIEKDEQPLRNEVNEWLIRIEEDELLESAKIGEQRMC